MGTFRMGRRVIRYVVRHSESKYAHLTLRDAKYLEVTLPQKSQVRARELLNKKRAWIERALQIADSRKRVFDGKQLLIWGAPYRLKVVKAKQNSVKVQGRTILAGLADGSDLRQSIKNWMTPRTRRYVTKKVSEYRRKLGFNIETVEIADSKRWGYCTRDRTLVFNWQLAALPRELTDYVLLHELSHSSEFNHNGRFRALLFSLCPDFREREQALRSIVPWLAAASAS